MATRQQLTVWIPVVLVSVLAVGYVEWRLSWTAKVVAPVREPSGAASPGANARGSNVDQRALALAAAANARAARAEQTAVDVKERLAHQDAAATRGDSVGATHDDDPEVQRAQREAYLHELEERFKAEPVDRAFQVEKESALQSTGAVLTGSGLSLAKVECASSMCKVKLEHPSRRPSRAALIDFLRAVHAEGSPLTRLAFNFKYEDGVTTLYGTTDTPSKEAKLDD
jgi:hypothetical protein